MCKAFELKSISWWAIRWTPVLFSEIWIYIFPLYLDCLPSCWKIRLMTADIKFRKKKVLSTMRHTNNSFLPEQTENDLNFLEPWSDKLKSKWWYSWQDSSGSLIVKMWVISEASESISQAVGKSETRDAIWWQPDQITELLRKLSETGHKGTIPESLVRLY